MSPMKNVIIMKQVSPPDMAAFISSGPSRERKTRSVKVMTVSHAWETTMGSLEKIVEFCKNKNIKLCFVIFPYIFQFRDIAGLSSPQKVLIEFLEERSIPYLDLLPEIYFFMREHYLKPGDLFSDYGHLNPRGSQVVARMITDFLMETSELKTFFVKNLQGFLKKQFF